MSRCGLKSNIGQAQILTVLVFFFLVPVTVIFAQNATLNATEVNFTGNFLALNITLPNSSNGTLLGFSNQSLPTNFSNSTYSTNSSNTAQQSSEPAQSQTNPPVSSPSPILEPVDPFLSVGLSVPQNATRGGIINVTAYVRNNGENQSHPIILEWILPTGFSLVQGDSVLSCQALQPQEVCSAVISLRSSMDAFSGPNSIQVRMTHG